MSHRIRLRALVVTFCLCAISIAAFQLIRASQTERIHSVVDTYTHVFAAKLRERLQSRFAFAVLIGEQIGLGESDFDERFESAARTVHRQLDDLQALNWASVAGVIVKVTPVKGNEKALGLDILSLAEPAKALRAAVAQNRPRATPPIGLAQGGRGFVAYQPVHGKDGLIGFLNLVFRAEPLIQSAMGENAAQSFHVSIHDGALPVHTEEIPAKSAPFAKVIQKNVAGRVWTVTIAPKAATMASAGSLLDESVLIVGCVLALVMGWLINESATSKAALLDREERFALAVKGASDGLYDWNPVTNDVYLSPRWFQMLGYEPDELPSSLETFSKLVHPDDLKDVIDDPDEIMRLESDGLENEFRMRHKDGSWRNILSRAYLVHKGGKVVRIVGTHVDVTELHDRQRELEQAAMTDDLTGLQNRRGLSSLLAMQVAALAPGQQLAVLHLDLDKFKSINDTKGHDAGDAALKVTADRLRNNPNEFDLIARVGGDEFVLAKKTDGGEPRLSEIAEGLITEVSAPYTFKGASLRVGASIGISLVNRGEAIDMNQAVSNADIALKAAKMQGRGQHVFFRPEMRKTAVRAAEVTNEIEAGLERNEFRAFFQPQIEIATGRVIGFEALARWHHPKRGILSAAEFVTYAESSHLVDAIDDRVFQYACQTLHLLSDLGADDTSISVNMSTAQLSDPNLVDRLAWAVDDADVSPERLCIEILESTLLTERTANVSDNIRKLAKAGFRLELDDFGTGHTAIASLMDFPVSRIKIDRSLITNIDTDTRIQTVTGALASLCNKLNIGVLAEGVETAAEMDFIAGTRCRFAQGYFISPPMPQDALQAWLRDWNVAHVEQRQLALNG